MLAAMLATMSPVVLPAECLAPSAGIAARQPRQSRPSHQQEFLTRLFLSYHLQTWCGLQPRVHSATGRAPASAQDRNRAGFFELVVAAVQPERGAHGPQMTWKTTRADL